MTRRIIRKKRAFSTNTEDLFGFIDQDNLPNRREAFGDIVRIYISVLLPLVVIAALLEAYVTPLIYQLFA